MKSRVALENGAHEEFGTTMGGGGVGEKKVVVSKTTEPNELCILWTGSITLVQFTLRLACLMCRRSLPPHVFTRSAIPIVKYIGSLPRSFKAGSALIDSIDALLNSFGC